MTIKVIIFDLDGTLVDTCDIHYVALNEAISLVAGPNYIISESDHINTFNGLNTKRKLQILTNTCGLNENLHDQIFHKKQELTEKYINEMVYENKNLSNCLVELKKRGYKIYCATNCIRKIGRLILQRLGILKLFDAVFTNEDVKNPKPNSEMYLKCLEQARRSTSNLIDPSEAIIFEDSPLGIIGAENSGCHVIKVDSPSELTLTYILNLITLFS